MVSLSDHLIPGPIRGILRGVGQVFFQENAWSGLCFIVGIAISSPLMAAGAVVGSVIGWGVGRVLKLDESEVAGGIHGFNPALVGIATFFFFKPGAICLALLAAGCLAATIVTWIMRRYVPFPTYTTPFIVTTWGLYFLGIGLGAARVGSGGPVGPVGFLGATAHGISQVMFQANAWTGLLFLVGIGLSEWRHAAWVLGGSFLGMLMGDYHMTPASRTIDAESLVGRGLAESVALGLYGYNATLAPVALYLSRQSLVRPILGIVLAVVFTELVPMLGLPALTAPFVLATWLALSLGWLESRLGARSPLSS